MQVLLLQNLGWILLFAGIILVCLSVISASKKSDSEDYETGTQSKGVIFLGPIPIVWGYGRRGWMTAGAIGIILLLVWIFAFL
ncbi:MAG: TIGR00304 family membrane protein [Candidatus Thorarchaeota archaeon]